MKYKVRQKSHLALMTGKGSDGGETKSADMDTVPMLTLHTMLIY